MIPKDKWRFSLHLVRYNLYLCIPLVLENPITWNIFSSLLEAARTSASRSNPRRAGWTSCRLIDREVVIFVVFERRADGHPGSRNGPQKMYWSCFSEGNFLRTYTKLGTQPSIMNEILTRNLTICKRSELLDDNQLQLTSTCSSSFSAFPSISSWSFTSQSSTSIKLVFSLLGILTTLTSHASPLWFGVCLLSFIVSWYTEVL